MHNEQCTMHNNKKNNLDNYICNQVNRGQKIRRELAEWAGENVA